MKHALRSWIGAIKSMTIAKNAIVAWPGPSVSRRHEAAVVSCDCAVLSRHRCTRPTQQANSTQTSNPFRLAPVAVHFPPADIDAVSDLVWLADGEASCGNAQSPKSTPARQRHGIA